VSAPPLTVEQKRRLAKLEPMLRDAARRGDYKRAKTVASDIQDVLRPTGHETRLMQAKNWLFQAAMENGELTTALTGFEGIRKKTRPSTRVYLEATALAAICQLRRGQLEAAKPLIAEALGRVGNIKSDPRRLQFERRMIQRFEQEWVISVLRQEDRPTLDVGQVQDDAGRLVQTSTLDEIEAYVGTAVPPGTVDRMLMAYEFSRLQLPPADRKCLPDPSERRDRQEVGRTLLSSAKRVIWKALCDPTSEVYKMWFNSGMMLVLDKKVLTASIVAALAGMRVGTYALAVAATAVVLKTGLEVFCDRFEPLDLMIERSDRR